VGRRPGADADPRAGRRKPLRSWPWTSTVVSDYDERHPQPQKRAEVVTRKSARHAGIEK
jgi:hypothetical protein